MSMTMEQVVTQLQQELFMLRAQVAAKPGLTDTTNLRQLKFAKTFRVSSM